MIATKKSNSHTHAYTQFEQPNAKIKTKKRWGKRASATPARSIHHHTSRILPRVCIVHVHNIQQWQQRADIEGVGMGRQQALSTLRISAIITVQKEQNAERERAEKRVKEQTNKNRGGATEGGCGRCPSISKQANAEHQNFITFSACSVSCDCSQDLRLQVQT
mmetsp:Transcript_5915/g.14231  ORF Transcript_5915/g.14231 Transcript_5915/m.14231 type:complete len:163 (+) Transcript_5915:299-787(+)